MPYGASPSFRHSSPYRCTPPGPSSTRTELHQTEHRQIHRGSIPIASESAVIIEPLGCRPEKAPTDPTARDRTREGIRGPDYKGAAAARASGARNTRRHRGTGTCWETGEERQSPTSQGGEERQSPTSPPEADGARNARRPQRDRHGWETSEERQSLTSQGARRGDLLQAHPKAAQANADDAQRCLA